MISFVYFDLGGVVDLDFSGTNKWKEVKNALGVKPEQNEEFDKWFDEKENLLCVGKEDFSLNYGNIKLALDDFVSRFEVNPSIWPVINEIHKSCKIGLLTNMYPGMFDAIKKKGILPNISWDINIDSSIVGIQKPDPRIFQLAEEKASTKGDQILFVENTPDNIKTAQAFGWQTFFYDPAQPVDSSRKLLKYFRKLK